MKKITLTLLALVCALCCAFGFIACENKGNLNPIQQYMDGFEKSSRVLVPVEKKSGEPNYYAPSDGYHLRASGDVMMSRGKNSSSMIATVIDKKAISVNGYYREFMYGINYFPAKDGNVMKVFVNRYVYRTVWLEERPNQFKCLDGFQVSHSENGSVLDILEFTVDLDKYFTTNALKVEDVTVVSDFNLEYIHDDLKYGSDKTYTERNPEWQTKAMEEIVASVAEVLEQINAYMTANPKPIYS